MQKCTIFKYITNHPNNNTSKYKREIEITVANLSNLKTGKAKAIRFSTLDAICKALECQPADIIEYTDNES